MTKSAIQPLLLYDGVCHLCDASIQFVIRNDKNKKIHFGQLQSPAVKTLISDQCPATEDLSSLVLLDEGKIYLKSDAWFRVMGILGWPWKSTLVFRLIPKFLRDGVYDWIGQHRYQWFGRSDQCLIPEPAISDRFVSDDDLYQAINDHRQ